MRRKQRTTDCPDRRQILPSATDSSNTGGTPANSSLGRPARPVHALVRPLPSCPHSISRDQRSVPDVRGPDDRFLPCPRGSHRSQQATREHVEMFLADFAENHKPATVQTRYKVLRLFFSFLLEERVITAHSMANMKATIGARSAGGRPRLRPVEEASLHSDWRRFRKSEGLGDPETLHGHRHASRRACEPADRGH